MATSTTSTPLPIGPGTKRRFVTLDAMRGVAALFVVLVHAGHGVGTLVLSRGVLAVDLFFMLSGFVLAFTYDRSFASGLTPGAFMRKRIARLAPIYLIGACLGIATCLLNPDLPTLHWSDLRYAAPLNLIGLPARGEWQPQVLFPINIVFWSLFLELWFLNLFWSFFWRRLQGRALSAVVVAFGLLYILITLNFHSTNVGFVWPEFMPSFVRAGFSFTVGIWLARYHAIRPPRLRVPSSACLVVLAVSLAMPLHGRIARAADLGCLFVLFPALIYFGAEAVERRPTIGRLLGNISYSLYATHYPLWVAAAWLCSHFLVQPNVGLELLFVVAASALALAIAEADEKLRMRLLRRKRITAIG